jgi:hypothetical protein
MFGLLESVFIFKANKFKKQNSFGTCNLLPFIKTNVISEAFKKYGTASLKEFG